jgi:hypothetical protein
MLKKEFWNMAKPNSGFITSPNGRDVIEYRAHSHPDGASNTAVSCPNYKNGGDRHCPENSLSMGWMINFQHGLGENLHCFQCDEPIGTFTEKYPSQASLSHKSLRKEN